LNSDFIMKLFDVQKTGSNYYLILEFCAGGDLGQFIKDNGPVPEQVAHTWFG
jgi:serine/threonine protein kinase